MCVVSMVSDHYRTNYPTPTQWTIPLYQDYWELKRKADLYDKMMNQPDCEKGDLAEFEKAIRRYLKLKD